MRAPLTALLLWSVACGGPAEPELDCSADDDGDGLLNCVERDELGTDPALVDSDGDGLTDKREVDCVSDPTDANEVCYACGWPHADPGTLVSTGAELGDVIANVPLVDQCGEEMPLWDMYGEWHVMYMTAEW